MESKLPGVGAVVGRFQVHWLHEGHMALLHRAAQHKTMMVFVGMSPFLSTQENPLDYQTRHAMIRKFFPEALIWPIMDRESDKAWSIELDCLINNHFSVHGCTIYSGRDGFHHHYTGRNKVEIVDAVAVHSGSEIRADIGELCRGTEDFRRGVIYATHQNYPRINPAVDVAVLRPVTTVEHGETVYSKNPLDVSVLMGKRRVDDKLFRFPGGFVARDDGSYENAARRELREETGLPCDGPIKFLGSFRVDDWRATQSSSIFTSLFLAKYTRGTPKAGDDLAAVAFVSLGALRDLTVQTHQPLVTCLEEELGYEPEKKPDS